MIAAWIWMMSAASAEDCPRLPLRVGAAPEFAILVEGLGACDGIVIPPSDVEDLARMAARLREAEAEAGAAKLEADALRLELRAATLERDWYRDEAARPPPILQRPGICQAAGGALVIGAAWAVGQVAR